MKFTQKKCNIRLPSTKSANALPQTLNQPSHSQSSLCKDKSKGVEDLPLMAHTRKLSFILRVTLNPQRSREHELSDRGAEACEEGVEWLLYIVSN